MDARAAAAAAAAATSSMSVLRWCQRVATATKTIVRSDCCEFVLLPDCVFSINSEKVPKPRFPSMPNSIDL